jgi:5'-phosphate synthase pdxT subunit
LVTSATIGVLALQGGVREHHDLLDGLGARVTLVRQLRDLIGPDGPRVDALVLPGGESSTIEKLLHIFDLFDVLRETIVAGMPTLGTCAGLVLLANEVLDPAPGQRSLQALDVTVRRNAFGSQVDSACTRLTTTLGRVRVAFIRAPVVTRMGPGVAVLGLHAGKVVGVQQGCVTGISFHPELTGESAFHKALVTAAIATRPVA